MVLLKKIREDLKSLADASRAKDLQRFFKTKPGEYGAGDKFLGIYVPELRKLAKKYYESDFSSLRSTKAAKHQTSHRHCEKSVVCSTKQSSFKILKSMLKSKFHEERLLALFILVLKYQASSLGRVITRLDRVILKSSKIEQKRIYKFYLANISGVNNWDLVDQSAPYIVGSYLIDKDKNDLYKLVKSKNLWKRRIAIVSTLHFVRNGYYKDALKLAKELLHDKEDLIHKATGWVLREVGKKDLEVLNKFLIKHYKKMPRTMLRYAIERFPEKLRKSYLLGGV